MTIQKLSMTVAALAALLLPAAALAAGDAAAGKTVFTTNCASCHGDSGKGNGPVGAALQPPPRDFTKAEFKFDTDGDGKTGTDADLKNVITQGAAAFGGSPLMAPWPTLSDADIANVIAFIRTFKGK
ncbi:MAG TPA: cytochrome c [Candidatus Polarisedimenticolia bacterium]|nr:cytochrome c [Candidatus Polarisedimenticolia bacterium]